MATKLATLQGTPKQIAWADSIRARMLRELDQIEQIYGVTLHTQATRRQFAATPHASAWIGIARLTARDIVDSHEAVARMPETRIAVDTHVLEAELRAAEAIGHTTRAADLRKRLARIEQEK